MKRYVNISIWIILIIGISILLGFINKEHYENECSDLDIVIDYQNGNKFISTDDIKSRIYQTGDSLKGQLLNKIDLEKILYVKHPEK